MASIPYGLKKRYWDFSFENLDCKVLNQLDNVIKNSESLWKLHMLYWETADQMLNTLQYTRLRWYFNSLRLGSSLFRKHEF